jgi:hypothetical protein
MRTQVREECVLLDSPSSGCSREDVDYAIAPAVGRGRDSDDFCCGDVSGFGGQTVAASGGGRHFAWGTGKAGWGFSAAGLEVLVYFAHFLAKGVFVHTASRSTGDTGSLVGASEVELENHG